MPRKEACESFYVCRDANCIFLFAAREILSREKRGIRKMSSKRKKEENTHILLNNMFRIKFFSSFEKLY